MKYLYINKRALSEETQSETAVGHFKPFDTSCVVQSPPAVAVRAHHDEKINIKRQKNLSVLVFCEVAELEAIFKLTTPQVRVFK